MLTSLKLTGTASPSHLSLPLSTPLSVARVGPRHVVLDLGHDVLRALHRDWDPAEVRDLDLLLQLFISPEVCSLKLLAVVGVQVSGSSLQPLTWPGESGSSGEPGGGHDGDLARDLLQGGEPLCGGGEREGRHQVGGAGVDQRSTVAKPAGRLPGPVTGGCPGVVLTEV